ncbi:tRNA lysidine(34) synthetase TilS [Vibrio furnissii]|uniref:tRNA lysidine(34) synthetase TilS n=1 Tax=Vibrio furnissii TaxID=29494 RepID=UPI003AA9DEDB
MDLYAHTRQLLDAQPSRHFVLAFSGGVDSRVLLALIARYRQERDISVQAVHVHHGLSVNADEWAQRCQHWCQAAQVPLAIERVSLATASGESIEKLAREARYAALATHMHPGSTLLLGQHADDQLETFLLALKRGSGPKGLASMAQQAPFSCGQLLRPLLSVSRAQIEHFALQHHLQWVEDESNQDERYERNFLRHRVTPILSERWPSIRQAVQRSAQLCAEQDELLAELLRDALHAATQGDGSLSVAVLTSHSDVLRRQLLRYWLAAQGLAMPSRVQLDVLWREVALAEADANPKLKLGECEIRRFQQCLYCVPLVQDVSAWQQPLVLGCALALPDHLGQLTLAKSKQGTLRCPSDPEHLWVTFNPEGLSACPVGRVGTRKLKKLFQEYQVPSWLRRRMPIVMHHQNVVAVANLFVDRDFSGQDCELIWDK